MSRQNHCRLPLVAVFLSLARMAFAVEPPDAKVPASPPAAETWTCFSTNGKTLEGIPAEIKAVEVVVYGDRVVVPMNVIRGIRFGSGLYDVCTVKLMNGDTLNGAIDQHVFKIATDWGEVAVERNRVQYLVRTAFARSAAGGRESRDTVPVATSPRALSPLEPTVETSSPGKESEELNTSDTWLWGSGS